MGYGIFLFAAGSSSHHLPKSRDTAVTPIIANNSNFPVRFLGICRRFRNFAFAMRDIAACNRNPAFSSEAAAAGTSCWQVTAVGGSVFDADLDEKVDECAALPSGAELLSVTGLPLADGAVLPPSSDSPPNGKNVEKLLEGRPSCDWGVTLDFEFSDVSVTGESHSPLFSGSSVTGESHSPSFSGFRLGGSDGE